MQRPETEANMIRASESQRLGRSHADDTWSAPCGPFGLESDTHEALRILALPQADVLRALAGWHGSDE